MELLRSCMLHSHYLPTAVVQLFVSWSLPSNRSTCHTASTYRCHHFLLSEGYAYDVCDWPHVPSPWLGSQDDQSPTAPAAPSLRLLALTGSLKRFKPVQVYHHHPRSRVPLSPVYHIIYMAHYLVWAHPWGFELERLPLSAGWVIVSHLVALLVVCRVGHVVVPSFHPVTGQLQVLVGITVDVM
jgi:hypothetical protein